MRLPLRCWHGNLFLFPGEGWGPEGKKLDRETPTPAPFIWIPAFAGKTDEGCATNT